jgi:hypothetical protein
MKAGHPVIASLDDMQRDGRKNDTAGTRHGNRGEGKNVNINALAAKHWIVINRVPLYGFPASVE